jgi:hypothetical protein
VCIPIILTLFGMIPQSQLVVVVVVVGGEAVDAVVVKVVGGVDARHGKIL